MKGHNEYTKSFYKIKEVAELLNIPQSTLRFCESEFSEINPTMNNSNIRFYTPSDIETLKIVRFLLKDKGLKIESAKLQLRKNKRNLEQTVTIIEKLSEVKAELLQISDALGKRK